VKSYTLSVLAEEDLIQIYIRGAADFGRKQASHYHQKLHQACDFLARTPQAGPERLELFPAVRIYPVGSHIVIYTIRPHDVYILCVRHQHEDWLNQPIADT
jgi:toxin ParE1/3/4